MSGNESCVVRMVNIDDIFTEETLKEFIIRNCQPNGDIKKMYLKKESKAIQLMERSDTNVYYFAYVIFENSHDAEKVVRILNGFTGSLNKKLNVELVGPDLRYTKYLSRYIVLGAYGRSGSSGNSSQSATIFIGGLPPNCEKDDLKELVEKYGPVNEVSVKYKQQNQRNAGSSRIDKNNAFAFVTYKKRPNALDAIKNLNGYEFRGCKISAKWSRNEKY